MIALGKYHPRQIKFLYLQAMTGELDVKERKKKGQNTKNCSFDDKSIGFI